MTSPFKVIIAGGSLGGLTLAHCLSRAGIDFILLESGAELAPHAGASLGVFPNGGRILDQLGVYDDIEAITQPVEFIYSRDSNGVIVNASDVLQFVRKRLGYPCVFLDRQQVLEVLADRLGENKTKVHLNKRVTKIEHSSKGVKVLTKDGAEYTGDIIVGADGVYSTVRSEMWRIADELNPGLISQEEKTAMFTEYSCIFGISTPTPGLEEGNSDVVFNNLYSFFCITGKNGTVFWFVFQKLPQKYTWPDIPRFTDADAEKCAHRFRNNKVSGTATFGDVWKNRTKFTMATLEENVFEHWNFGRIVCLGDSIHKFTPNLGQGANCAIESAAALANHLHKLVSQPYSHNSIAHSLQHFADSQKGRIKEIYKASALNTRMQAQDGLLNRILQYYMFKIQDEMPLNLACDLIVGAPKVNYLPVPERSVAGFMPFDERLGITKGPSVLQRAREAFVFVALFAIGVYLTWTTQDTTTLLQRIKHTSGRDSITLIRTSYTRIPTIDVFLTNLVTLITPLLSPNPLMLSFAASLLPIHTIYTIETHRTGNNLTLPTFPLFALSSHPFTFAILAPLYHFIHYVQTSAHTYASLEQRIVPLNRARTIIPALTASMVIPAIFTFGAIDLSAHTRQGFAALWLLFPVSFAVVHRVLTGLVPDTKAAERHAPGSDIPVLRRTYVFAGVVAAVAHVYVVCCVGLQGLGVGYWLGFGSSLVWAGMTMWDLEREGRTVVGLGEVVAVVGGTTVFGPGAGVVGVWMWREEVLGRRRMGGR